MRKYKLNQVFFSGGRKMMIFWLFLGCLQPSSATSDCGPLNRGASLSQPLINIIVDGGWYYEASGTADFDSSPRLVFSRANADPFYITMVDAYCPGDRYLLSIIPPVGGIIDAFSSSTFFLNVNCSAPQVTSDPNVAFSNHESFSYYQRLFNPGQAGDWSIFVYNQLGCSTLPPPTIGNYVRVDSFRLTRSVCAFSSSSIVSAFNKVSLSR